MALYRFYEFSSGTGRRAPVEHECADDADAIRTVATISSLNHKCEVWLGARMIYAAGPGATLEPPMARYTSTLRPAGNG